MTFDVKLIFILIVFYFVDINGIEIDPNGYIIYCPCMGRFGNQAEQLLGSLQFSKSLNRTLILPPFIQYNHFKVNFIPFEDYIKVEPIKQFHRVITIEKFMTELAPIVWPEESRTIVCYSSRGTSNKGCNPFDGNPFKSFWDHLGIKTFANGSQYHAPLLTDFNFAEEWKQKFANLKVLAFVGAPSAFPTNGEAVKLQQYINLSSNVVKLSDKYRETRGFARKPYLALHLRHGSDWIKACDLLKENPEMTQLFSSQQCKPSKHNPLPYELCYPSFETIIEQINQTLIESINKEKIEIIYIATDNNNETLWQIMHQNLPNITLITPKITISSSGVVSKHSPPNIITDIHIMSYANRFIGNCISSFSAFVSRLRIFNLNFDKTTQFFSQNNANLLRDEL